MPVGLYPRFTFEEYLAKNARSGEKLEFLQGVVYAMAGGSLVHCRLGVRLTILLENRLAGRGCFAMSSDGMVLSPGPEAGFYPDVSVHCGSEFELGAARMENPVLVVEVLSPSTRNFDLGDKLLQYKRIPSLRHILYVDSEALELRLYSRGEGEVWPGEPIMLRDREARFILEAFGVEIGLREIYGELEFD